VRAVCVGVGQQNTRRPSKKMQDGRAKVKQKNARRSSKKMKDGGAEAKQKMSDGRAKVCEMAEQKLHK
jgi:hypothetical protein